MDVKVQAREISAVPERTSRGPRPIYPQYISLSSASSVKEADRRIRILQNKMRWSLPLLLLSAVATVLAKMPVAKYRQLPTLREQDRLEKVWVKKRHEFIPSVLKKQSVPSMNMNLLQLTKSSAVTMPGSLR